jgi:hypothetical protein
MDFLTLNDQYHQIGGEPSPYNIAICVGILLVYLSLTILTIVYFNKNKTSNLSKNEIFNKNGLFVALMLPFIGGIISTIWIGDNTIQIAIFSSLLCAIGLITGGIFYAVI